MVGHKMMHNANRDAAILTERHRGHSVFISLARVFGLAVIYFVVSKLGLLFAIPPGYATAVWPVSGIALGCLLVYGVYLWPGVFLGSLLVNITEAYSGISGEALPSSLLVSASISVGAAIQAVLGAVLIRRYVGLPTVLDDDRDVIKFLFLGGPLVCLLNATWGSATLLISGAIFSNVFLITWWTWWVGNTIGVLIFTPLVRPGTISRNALSSPMNRSTLAKTAQESVVVK